MVSAIVILIGFLFFRLKKLQYSFFSVNNVPIPPHPNTANSNYSANKSVVSLDKEKGEHFVPFVSYSLYNGISIL